jgi:hypothetical protein
VKVALEHEVRASGCHMTAASTTCPGATLESGKTTPVLPYHRVRFQHVRGVTASKHSAALSFCVSMHADCGAIARESLGQLTHR